MAYDLAMPPPDRKRAPGLTARELVAACLADEGHYQLHVNDWVDRFRAASTDDRRAMAAQGPSESGKYEGLVSAIVSVLCRDAGDPAPSWVETVGSPEPFFVLPARSLEMRLRLMLESPPAFQMRRVFVPENYLSRA